MLKMGDQMGTIIEHGTDTSRSGLPLVWVSVRLDSGEEGTANIFLASDKGEQQDTTAKRMARAALKLCGFDPDTQEVEDLGFAEKMLAGNRVPVSVSKSKDGQYTNFNIQPARGIKPEQAKSLTAALRAVKSKDEPEVAKPSAPAPAKPNLGAPIAGVDEVKFDDIPF